MAYNMNIFVLNALAVNTECFRRPEARQFHFMCCRIFWCCVPLSYDICKMLSVSLMSHCSKYCHGLPWHCHLQRRAARYSGRPSLGWPLTSVSLARGQKLSPWPSAKISKAFSIFKTTAVAQHTPECNFRFCWHAVILSEFHPNLSGSVECSSVKDGCCDAHTAGRQFPQGPLHQISCKPDKRLSRWC